MKSVVPYGKTSYLQTTKPSGPSTYHSHSLLFRVHFLQYFFSNVSDLTIWSLTSFFRYETRCTLLKIYLLKKKTGIGPVIFLTLKKLFKLNELLKLLWTLKFMELVSIQDINRPTHYKIICNRWKAMLIFKNLGVLYKEINIFWKKT